MFLTPHKFARHKQLPALRNLDPAEREVVLLLGSDVRPAKGQLLINYDEKARQFYFVLEGEVVLERSGVTLQRVVEGEFLVGVGWRWGWCLEGSGFVGLRVV